MYKVIKRDGTIVEFNPEKIGEAIKKAFAAVNREYHQSVIDLLVLRTCSDFEEKIKNKKISVEDIQDSVEKVLSDANYADVAKAYILYRKQREKARNIDLTLDGYNKLVNSYVDANKKEAYSVGGLVMSTAGAIASNYWLSEIYDDQIANAHKNKDIEICDLNMLTGHSLLLPLDQIIAKGIVGGGTYISSAPAKHLNTLCNQLVNLLSIIQNEWAGALYLDHFDSLLANFIKEENLDYKEVKGAIETFIYGINMPTCLGGKTPDVNILLDYSASKEVRLINKAILEILMHGDSKGNVFNNPKFIYKLSKDYKFTDEVDKLLLKYSSSYKEVYFLNSDLANKQNKGSLGMVSINLNKLIDASSFEEFVSMLDKQVDIACRSLKIKKDVISKLLENGLYPYTSKYVDSFDDLYSSITLLGLDNKYFDEIKVDVLNHLKACLKENEERYGCLYELKLIKENDNISMFDDLFEEIDNKEKLLPLYDAGGVLDICFKKNNYDYKALGDLYEKILNNYKIPCFVLRNNKV